MDLSGTLQSALGSAYLIERQLGRGGMATVYLARDLRHDRPVALKVLLPELALTLGPERFLREIKFAARLQHPHICSVYDSGEVGTSREAASTGEGGQLWADCDPELRPRVDEARQRIAALGGEPKAR